jgi:hypothetical protein
MMSVQEPLLVTPAAVDLRLYVHEVTLGWKTVAQAQAEIDAEPSSVVARRIRALALVPGLVEALEGAPLEQAERKMVLFTCFKAVIVACQESWTRDVAVSIYRRTPEEKKEKVLQIWRTTPTPILLVHVNRTDWRLDLSAATDAIFIDESPKAEEKAHVRTWLRPGIRVRVCEAAP